MFAQGVLLSNCADQFFNREKWEALVAKCGNKREAINVLNRVHDVGMALIRVLAKDESDLGRFFQPASAAYDLGQEIVKDLRDRLAKGEIVATGIDRSTGLRIPIPAALWSELVPHFRHDRAKSALDDFVDVRIQMPEGEEKPTRPQHVVETCVAWLKQRRATRGYEPKKVLKKRALQDIKLLSHRHFDSAYTIAFGHKRGRPRKSG